MHTIRRDDTAPGHLSSPTMMTARISCLAGVALFLLAGPAWAQATAERFELARKAIAAGKFADAVTELDAVLNTPGNDEATMVALYELQGITWTGLKKATPAKTAFQRMLLLAPQKKLTGKQPPKVTQAFNDAKKLIIARAPDGLMIEQLTPELTAGKVTAILIAVENDVLKLAKKLRVHLRIDGAAWTVSEVDPLAMSRTDVSGKVVEYWAEVLGDKGAVLKTLASQAAPLVDAVPGAKAPAKDASRDSPKDAPKVEVAGGPKLTPDGAKDPGPQLVERPGKPLKVPVVSVVLAGAAVAAGGTALFFGLRSNSARREFTNAATDANGVTTTLTRVQALELEKQAGTDAIVANTLMGAAIGLALGAIPAFIFGQGGTP
mgnify:CR=1 FL=1